MRILEQTTPDFILVAAIDFGSTFTTYAYSFTASKNDILFSQGWVDNLGLVSRQAPTSILLTPDKEFQHFGFEAQEAFAALMEDGRENYYYFERFTMTEASISVLVLYITLGKYWWTNTTHFH